MPIYDYVCGSCGHRFEVFRGINEAGPHQCPECGGPVARAFVPPTIHFKGTGWAKTDRRATSAPSRRAEAGPSSSGPSKSEPSREPSGEHGKSGESGKPSEESRRRPGEPAGTAASADSSSSSGGGSAEASTSSQADR